MYNLIFDYDGTLHNCIKIYSLAFKKACSYLAENGYLEEWDFDEKDIKHWLGFNSIDMWNEFMPSLPQSQKKLCSEIIGKSMLEATQSGQAELYAGVLDVLKKLKDKGYNLIFLSNCKRSYMAEHMRFFNLDRYFNNFYCAEDFGFIPKFEIFDKIKDNFKGEFIVIGDRFQDIEVAKKHNLKSIACLYGYANENELDFSTYKVESIEQLYDKIIEITV